MDLLVGLSQDKVRLQNNGPASNPPVSILYDFLGSWTTDYYSLTSPGSEVAWSGASFPTVIVIRQCSGAQVMSYLSVS